MKIWGRRTKTQTEFNPHPLAHALTSARQFMQPVDYFHILFETGDFKKMVSMGFNPSEDGLHYYAEWLPEAEGEGQLCLAVEAIKTSLGLETIGSFQALGPNTWILNSRRATASELCQLGALRCALNSYQVNWLEQLEC